MKVAVVSNPLPPSFSGQAMMLYRLLKDVRPEEYCLISSENPQASDEQSYSRRLPGKYFQLTTKYEMKRGYHYGLSLVREAYNITAGAYMRARQIARIVKEERCEAVLSCSSGVDLLDVPAGFLASRLARVPFYVYLFDTYSHMWVNPQTQFIGKRIEPYIMRGAAGVVSTNETVRELLRERYGIDSVVIHNPCDISEYEKTEAGDAEEDSEDVRVVYTGAIYAAQADALANLARAIELLDRPRLKLHLYTLTPTEMLEGWGIRGPVVYHGHLPVFEMPGVQRRADVLFLPLAFVSPFPELIKVSSPSKVGEFLASRRPVLVHAPPGSFLSTYFREHDCGVVVDRSDPALLAEALARLLDDEGLRRRLTANAWERAVSDFSLEEARARFSRLLQLRLAA